MSNIEKKSDSKRRQVQQQIFRNLLEITELYPKYPLPQHLSAILRRKDTQGNGKEFFHWTEEELLNRIEKYKDELEGEDLMNISED